jgi:hypothetical protein
MGSELLLIADALGVLRPDACALPAAEGGLPAGRGVPAAGLSGASVAPDSRSPTSPSTVSSAPMAPPQCEQNRAVSATCFPQAEQNIAREFYHARFVYPEKYKLISLLHGQ